MPALDVSILSAMALAALATTSPAQIIRLDAPAAIVNERVITEREVLKRARTVGGGAGPVEARKVRAFQDLLHDAIVSQARAAASFDERMIDERVKQQMRLLEEEEGSRSQLQAELARQGQTVDESRKRRTEEMRRFVLFESLTYGVGPTGRSSEDDYFSPRRMLAWYRRNPTEFREPAAVKARICVAQFTGESDGAEARSKAQSWLARAAGGTALAELAQAESSWNPDGGGELSGDRTGAPQWVSTEVDGAMDPALRRACEGRAPGLVPEVVRTPEGYAVIELLDVRAAGRRPFEDPEVQREIASKLRKKWRAERNRETEDELFAGSYVWPPRLRGDG